MRYLLTIALAMICSSTSQAKTVRNYSIGNSLTFDSRQPGIDAMADSVGNEYIYGQHIYCNQTLENIWSNPSSTCITPNSFGTFNGAIQNYTWDSISFQPFPSAWMAANPSTLMDDQTTINSMMELALTNTANADSTFYVYTGWPNTTSPYQTKWDTATPDSDSQLTTQTRDYMTHLLDRVRDDHPTIRNQIYMIDVGEVFYELDKAMASGAIEGFDSVHDIYRDNTHASLKIGRFVASSVYYATTFRENPIGIQVPSGWYESGEEFTSEARLAMQSIVWDYVTSNPTRTGVFLPGDMNGDGLVNDVDIGPFVLALTDRATFLDTYPLVPPELPGDFNADGLFNLGDVSGFALAIPSSSATSVPEPSCLPLLLALLATPAFRRLRA